MDNSSPCRTATGDRAGAECVLVERKRYMNYTNYMKSMDSGSSCRGTRPGNRTAAVIDTEHGERQGTEPMAVQAQSVLVEKKNLYPADRQVLPQFNAATHDPT
jgi:hypothetical protein